MSFALAENFLVPQILLLESDLREREEELKAAKEREIQTAQDEWLKMAVHHQDMQVTAEEQEEHIYEEPPEVGSTLVLCYLQYSMHMAVCQIVSRRYIVDVCLAVRNLFSPPPWYTHTCMHSFQRTPQYTRRLQIRQLPPATLSTPPLYSRPLKILQTEGEQALHTTVNSALSPDLFCSVHQSTMISDLDRSKPYVPVLDSSSQLMEDSFVVGEKRTEIHVTPLAKKKRMGRTRKRKRDTEMEKVDTKVSGQAD